MKCIRFYVTSPEMCCHRWKCQFPASKLSLVRSLPTSLAQNWERNVHWPWVINRTWSMFHQVETPEPRGERGLSCTLPLPISCLLSFAVYLQDFKVCAASAWVVTGVSSIRLLLTFIIQWQDNTAAEPWSGDKNSSRRHFIDASCI